MASKMVVIVRQRRKGKRLFGVKRFGQQLSNEALLSPWKSGFQCQQLDDPEVRSPGVVRR